MFHSFFERIDRAYERRLRRASGLDQPQQGPKAHTPEELEDEHGSAISNVARGAEVATPAETRPALSDLSNDLPPPPIIRPAAAAVLSDEEEDEGTIVNL